MLLKYLKGTMKISLPKKQYFYGDMIEGSIDIKAKKHIEVQMIEASLIAYRRESTYTNKGTKTRNVEVFRQTDILWGEDTLLAGSTRGVPLKIKIPKITDFQDDIQMMIEHKNKIVRSFQKYYRNVSKTWRLRWKLRVDLKAEGIDLVSRESIEILAPIHSNNI